MLEPILFFAVTAAFINWTAEIDAELINQKIWIHDHSSRWLQRASFFLAIAVFNPFYCFAATLLFIASFDHVLNLKRSLPFWYIGTVAEWDKLFKPFPGLFKAVKFLAVGTSLGLFVSGGFIYNFIILTIKSWL